MSEHQASGPDQVARIVSNWLAHIEHLDALMPGPWTLADVARSRTIIQAEATRRVARHAIFGELRAACERFPQAASAEEACRLAGIDLAAIDRRLAAIPPEDDVGWQWLVSEYAKAVQDGTLMATKV